MSNRTPLLTGLLRVAAQGIFVLTIVGTLAIGWWKIDIRETIERLRRTTASRTEAPPPKRILKRPLLAPTAVPPTPPPPVVMKPVETQSLPKAMSTPSIRRTVISDRAVRPVAGMSPAGSLSFPAETANAVLSAPLTFAQVPPPVPATPALPVIAPVPVAPPQVESAPTPSAIPFDRLPTAVVTPPTAPPIAPTGGFLAYGTITPADVRSMALRNNKEIAVLGYLPPRDATLVDSEASVFDPVFNVALAGGHYNRQVATQVQALSTSSIPELRTTFWQPLNGLNQVYLEKLFVTGGRVQVGLGQNSTNYAPAGSLVFVNPAYQSSVNLQLDQPLFRGRGPAATTALLQIARANQEQSWQVFLATVSQVLRDADYAYWDLYAAFQDWEVRDLAVRQAAETLDRERGRLQLGEGSIPDVAQAQEQFEAFHIARTEAENRLVSAQRILRRVMGLVPGDERPLIPATAPSDAPVELDWNYAADEARNRPEFAAQQAAVTAAEVELARRRNGLLPDLSVRGIYSITGLDDTFDQSWSNVGDVKYSDWTAGVIYRQPLGRRNDRALASRAEITLALESARLRQLEHEILHQLDAAFQRVQNTQRLLEMHRRRREAAAVQLAARRELYLENRASLRDQLDAEVRHASALYDESTARIAYQRALTEWNYARGALVEADVVAAR